MTALKIVQILPGSGDRFYCENCVRDTGLVRALRAAGHEVLVAPLYLPQFVDAIETGAGVPVFYGGINAYLQQNFAFFRKSPRWLDRLFDSRFFLRLAARRAGSVRASGLGEMTLSVLQGADGNQAKELDRLLRWMESMERPNVVHLSSPLLLGIGVAIQRRFSIPLVCTMQDEDDWIDAMEEPHRTLCWKTMAEAGRSVDAFIAVSRHFAGVMRDRLQIDPERLHVVPVGVDPAVASVPPDPPALGYLARLSRGMGLGVLAEAFLKLKRTDAHRNLRLHLCGGLTDDDRPFLEELGRTFAAAGVDRDVKFYESIDAATRQEFLSSLTCLSVPSPKPIAFGTFLLEAAARGVPVVQPKVGAFPELVDATGGGVLYEPNDADTLAGTLSALLSDGPRRAELGRKGREAVRKVFSLEAMAASTLEIYRGVAAGKVSRAAK